MPVVPVYITLVITSIPILIKLGLEPFLAHFFCFFYGGIIDAQVFLPIAVNMKDKIEFLNNPMNETRREHSRVAAEIAGWRIKKHHEKYKNQGQYPAMAAML